MATKKGSKTAHVLNVLSNPRQDPAGGGGMEETVDAQQGQSAPSRPVRVPILEVARANDDALSDQIRELLEEDLVREEQAVENITQVMEHTTEPALESHLEGKRDDTPIEATVAQPEAIPSQVKVESKRETAVETGPVESVISSLKDKAQLDDDFRYVNIMQALVEEKCMKYMNMFGLCTCSRCIADVKALALSNLSPKYSVMHEGQVIPMLTVYEGRFNSTLTAQILSACKIVTENPRHK